MTSPSFRLKLDRANEHLNCFDAESEVWIKSKPYGLVDEPDPEPPPQPIANGARPHRIRVNFVREDIPAKLSLIIGDCLFNLRSALDHLALSLGQARTGNMSAKAISTSEFPIYTSAAKFEDDKIRKIGCADPGAIAAIEALQPYHRGNGYSSHPLWQLHELNRIDKHRALTVVAGFPLWKGWTVVELGAAGSENWAGPPPSQTNMQYWQRVGDCLYEMNAVWVRWGPFPVDPKKDVRVDCTAPIEIVFGQGSPATAEVVSETLRRLLDYVGDVVVPQLAKFL